MEIKYNINIHEEIVLDLLKKLTNQIYKLLPYREEGVDWVKPLETIMEQLSGLQRLTQLDEENYFLLLTKLEGLFELSSDEDFGLFRRIIFECLGILEVIRNNVKL